MLETRIAGIPCQIKVDSHLVVPPWRGNIQDCPSDADYYGYTEVEFTVYDRKGYKADWLRDKMTAEDEERIINEISDI